MTDHAVFTPEVADAIARLPEQDQQIIYDAAATLAKLSGDSSRAIAGLMPILANDDMDAAYALLEAEEARAAEVDAVIAFLRDTYDVGVDDVFADGTSAKDRYMLAQCDVTAVAMLKKSGASADMVRLYVESRDIPKEELKRFADDVLLLNADVTANPDDPRLVPLARMSAMSAGLRAARSRRLDDGRIAESLAAIAGAMYAYFCETLKPPVPPIDYADGEQDVRMRTIVGARKLTHNTNALTMTQMEAWMLDMDTYMARAARHEYTMPQIREADDVVRRSGLITEDDVRRLDSLLSNYAVGPAHLEALEQQWKSYRFNLAILPVLKHPGLSALQPSTCEALKTAATYCWSPLTIHAVSSCADGLPDSCALNDTALGDLAAPGTSGWWWFQEPIPIKTTDRSADVEPVVALLWRRELNDGVLSLWCQTFTMQRKSLNDKPQTVAMPTAAWIWKDGDPLGALPAIFATAFGPLYESAPPSYKARTADGPGSAEVSETVNACVWFSKFFMAASMWLRQRIVVESSGEGVRQVARQIQRAHKLADAPRVRIIELRRRETVRKDATAEVTPTGRKLTCRFVVNGFTRNQWYATRGEHAPKWIEPFMKGPTDAPLKEGARVYAVRR